MRKKSCYESIVVETIFIFNSNVFYYNTKNRGHIGLSIFIGNSLLYELIGKANIKETTAPTKVIAPNQSIFVFYELVILYKRM